MLGKKEKLMITHYMWARKSTYQLAELEKSLYNINSHNRNNPNATIVIAGDFNLGDVDWDSGTVPPGARERSNREK